MKTKAKMKIKRFILFIVIPISISCYNSTKETNKLDMQDNIKSYLTYLTYFEPDYKFASAGFLIRFYNPNEYDIYLPYIRGLRSILVEQIKKDKFEFIDPSIYWSTNWNNNSPFFSPDIFFHDSIIKAKALNSLRISYPKIDELDLSVFIHDCCFISSKEKVDIFLPCYVFPNGIYRAYLVTNCLAIPILDDTFKKNPPKEIGNYKLYTGNFQSDTINFEIKTKNNFLKLDPN
jgi:hypothetical protein